MLGNLTIHDVEYIVVRPAKRLDECGGYVRHLRIKTGDGSIVELALFSLDHKQLELETVQ